MRKQTRVDAIANSFHLPMHWKKVTDGNRGDHPTIVGKIANAKEKQTHWRHNQAGDLAGNGTYNLKLKLIFSVIKANKGKRGWTYTHYDVINDKHNANVIEQMVGDGHARNIASISVSILLDADELYDTGIAPVTTILASLSND